MLIRLAQFAERMKGVASTGPAVASQMEKPLMGREAKENRSLTSYVFLKVVGLDVSQLFSLGLRSSCSPGRADHKSGP